MEQVDKHLEALEVPLLRQPQHLPPLLLPPFATLPRGKFRDDGFDKHRDRQEAQVDFPTVLFEAGSEGKDGREVLVGEGPELAEGGEDVGRVGEDACGEGDGG